MVALTDAQITSINSAISDVQSYISVLLTALSKAAAAGDSSAGMEIDSRYEDAQSLENKLKGMLTISLAADLAPAVAAVKNTASTLTAQANQIDKVVNDIGVAADVVGDIAEVAAAIAKIA